MQKKTIKKGNSSFRVVFFYQQKFRKMKHTDYVKTDNWFAWHPVILVEGGIAWFIFVTRTIVYRPIVFSGELISYSYSRLY